MRCLKQLAVAAVAAMALTAFTAGSASATTLEVGGTAQATSNPLTATLTAGRSTTFRTTGGLFANTCTSSHVAGATTSPFTAAGKGTIGGHISSLSFGNCTEEKVVVDASGIFSIEWIEGTTNATLQLAGTTVTLPSPFGTLHCSTGAGTDIGKLTGAAAGKHAVIDLNGVINCGIIPSSVWQGEYTITSPTGLGVVK